MENLRKDTPPEWAIRFLRWFCRPEFREDIEGDLLEQFHNRITIMSTRKARWLFIRDVFSLFRSGIIRDISRRNKQKQIIMKRTEWFKLAGINILVVLMIISPFIPGPSNKLVGALSFAGQLTGIGGLLLVPLGLAWTIIEARKSGNENKKVINPRAQYQLAILAIALIMLVFLLGTILLPNPMTKLTFLLGLLLVLSGFGMALNQIKKWKGDNEKIPGYGPTVLLAASAIACITLLYLFTVLAVIMMFGIMAGIIGLLFLPILLTIALKQIRNLKDFNEKKFNTAPLYLVTIPAFAFLTFMFLIRPASNFSRNYAIKRSETLITAIENHKNKTGEYPGSLQILYAHAVKEIPTPFIMGIENFRYNKIDDKYSLSFSQWLDLGSLEEIVLFDKSNLKDNLTGRYSKYDYNLDLYRARGALAAYNTRFDNWRYYHSD